MSIKKFIHQIHLWLGLASGLVVLILGITGCIWAFEPELKQIVYHGHFTVTPKVDSKPRGLAENFKVAQAALGNDLPITHIAVYNDTNRSYLFTALELREQTSGIFDDKYVHFQNVYTNPYTTEILKNRDQSTEFFRVALNLHRHLLLREDIGTTIIGISTLIFIILLVSGIILWWPHNKKALKMNTWFRWKKSTEWKRKNYDLHNILGFYSSFFLLFIAVTGLMWSFEWFNSSIQWVANGGQMIEKEAVEVNSNPAGHAFKKPLDKILQHAQTNYPEAKAFWIRVPQEHDGFVGNYVDYKNNTKDVYVQYDQYTGEVLQKTGWGDKTNGEKINALKYDIHTGLIVGLLGQTVAFFISLFAASLPITGFLIWYGRNYKKRKRKPLRRKKAVKLKPSETS